MLVKQKRKDREETEVRQRVVLGGCSWSLLMSLPVEICGGTSATVIMGPSVTQRKRAHLTSFRSVQGKKSDSDLRILPRRLEVNAFDFWGRTSSFSARELHLWRKWMTSITSRGFLTEGKIGLDCREPHEKKPLEMDDSAGRFLLGLGWDN